MEGRVFAPVRARRRDFHATAKDATGLFEENHSPGAESILRKQTLREDPMRNHLRGVLALALGVFLALASNRMLSQQVDTRKTSTPYTGDLSIFDSPGREDRLQIERVMDLLSITPGKTVADIGAGSGWFTVRAARRVTSSGTVYAEDINFEAIAYITNRAQKEQLVNIRTILGHEDNPLLPAGQVDAVLMLKTYHEVAKPVTLLRNLRVALKTGAKVGIIDRNGNGTNHGVNREVVLKEAAQAGYDVVGQYDFVKDDMNYFLVLAPKAN
jgi:SAM-dependent methyltransferase